jgi:curved DNA-binding protein CbpA
MQIECDHYQVLNLSADASEDEIKKNYRKLAKEWHPGAHFKTQFEQIQDFST